MTRKASVPLSLAAICGACVIALTQTTCNSAAVTNPRPAPADAIAGAGAATTGALTATQVSGAVRKGLVYLLQTQAQDGHWEARGDSKDPVSAHRAGTTALALYALLELGMSPQHPNIKRGLAWLNAQEINNTDVLAMCAGTLRLAAAR